jgi:dihydrodipicolinate reductase
LWKCWLADISFARLCGALGQELAEAAQHRSEHALHAAQAAAFELRASLQSVQDQAAEVQLRLEQARAETVVEQTARTEAEAHARAADEQHQRDVEEMQALQRALSGTLERVETAEAALTSERVAASRAAETAEQRAREQGQQLQAAQLRCSQLMGEHEAIQECSLEQLHALMQALEVGGTKLRRAVLAAEVEAASRAEAAEAAACAVCFTRR